MPFICITLLGAACYFHFTHEANAQEGRIIQPKLGSYKWPTWDLNFFSVMESYILLHRIRLEVKMGRMLVGFPSQLMCFVHHMYQVPCSDCTFFPVLFITPELTRTAFVILAGHSVWWAVLCIVGSLTGSLTCTPDPCPSCDHQKCLQLLPSVSYGHNCPAGKNHWERLTQFDGQWEKSAECEVLGHQAIKWQNFNVCDSWPDLTFFLLAASLFLLLRSF